MKLGNVSGSVKKRSIDQQIKSAKRTGKNGAGDFCAIFASSAIYGDCEIALERTFQRAYDAAIVAGMTQLSANLHLWMPLEASEDELRRKVRAFDRLCAEKEIVLSDICCENSRIVNQILMEVSVAGAKREIKREGYTELDVVAVGYAGCEGSMILAEKEEKLLLTRYPARMLHEAKGFSDLLGRIPEAATAIRSNICMARVVGEGGILSALWDLADTAGVGLNIDWKAVPVKQETIEICNFLDLNPYELLSGGSMVIFCEEASEIVEKLREEGIPAAYIGRTTQSKDRVLCVDGERRFMEPGITDELFKRMEK